jgi:hypothetical protein
VKFSRILQAAISSLVFCLSTLAQSEGTKTEKAEEGWQAPLYKIAQNPEYWAEFQRELLNRNLFYGAMAAALRGLQYHGDVDSKQSSYEILVALLDQGLPIRVREAFHVGDIEPTGDPNFINSYYLYKSMLNAERGLTRWSEFYKKQITQTDFTKLYFFQAIQKYQEKKFSESRELLEKILAQNEKTPLKVGFLKKVTRTLARIYFEEENYKKSLDIYKNFLLRLNPITSLDWLEAAWNAYYLNEHAEAIGYLYNLESKTFSDWEYFERYLLLALIYKDFCNTDLLKALSRRFKDRFGETLQKIRMGEPLRKIPKLLEIYPKGSFQFIEETELIRGLESESKQISVLPSRFEPAARFLYRSEISYIKRNREMKLDDALSKAAEQVVMLYESLRFLGFDIAREKFNPDVIFQQEDKRRASSTLLVKRNSKAETYELAWRQYGDYWRDERMLYRGKITNLCLEARR